jgi:hypothetical protein
MTIGILAATVIFIENAFVPTQMGVVAVIMMFTIMDAV